MTDALLLDTHIVLWLDSGDQRLRRETRDFIDACWNRRGSIYVSAITAWEIALLIDGGRIRLDLSAAAWMTRLLARPGIVAVPLSVKAAASAYALEGLEHRDPADRMLIATAIELACPMVSYDERIVAFGEREGRQQGFAVASDVRSR